MRFYKNLSIVLILTLLVTTGILAFHSKYANALGAWLPDWVNDYSRVAGNPPNGNPKIVVSKIGYDNSLESEEAYVKVYFDTPDGNVIDIHGASFCGYSTNEFNNVAGNQADGIDPSDTYFQIFGAKANDDIDLNPDAFGVPQPLSQARAQPNTYCNAPLSFGVSGLAASTFPGHQGKYVAYIKAKIARIAGYSYVDAIGTRGAVNVFNPNVKNGNGTNAVAGYYALNSAVFNPVNPANVGPGIVTVQDRGVAPAGVTDTRSDFHFKFAPNCETSTANQTGYLRWGNLEQGGPLQNPRASFSLRTYNRNTGALVSTRNFTPPDDLNPISVQSITFNVQRDYKYEWSWYGIQRDNALQIWMPFDSVDYNFTCDKPVEGDISGGAGCDLGSKTYIDQAGNTKTEPKIGLVGWSEDPDHYPTNVEVYMDVEDAYHKVGTYSASNYPSFASPPPPYQNFNPKVPAWHNWYIVPKADLDVFRDSFDHTIIVKMIGLDTNGNPNGRNVNRTTGWGKCTMPTCQVNSDTANPEIGTNFGLTLSYSYAVPIGAKGRPIDPDGAVRLDPYFPTNRFYHMVGIASHTFGDASDPPQYNVPVAGPYTTPGSITQPGVFTVFCGPGGSPAAVNVGRYPYYKIYGNDAQAGGRFAVGNSCSAVAANPAATFRGYNKGGPGPAPWLVTSYDFMRGAGAQFGLFALGSIQEVASAGMRPVIGTHKPIEETIANSTISAGIGSYKNTYGGNGGISNCIPDYFSKYNAAQEVVQSSLTPGGIAAIPASTAPIRFIKQGAGQPPIIVKNITNYSAKQTVYVDGDVRIQDGGVGLADGIIYKPFTNSTDIPNFTLVVRGNIYIDNATDQLDGTYIAQPKADGSKGLIVTCYYTVANTPVPSTEIANTCNHKLTFNGAVIAKEVKLLRTQGTLSSGLESTPAVPFDFSWNYNVNAAGVNAVNCRQIDEGDDFSTRGTWHDNWLCADPGVANMYGLKWSPAGPIAGKTCVLFNEPAEWQYLPPTSWQDNYLCYDNRDGHNLQFYHGGGNDFPGTAQLNATNPGWQSSASPLYATWTGTDTARGKQVRCVRILEPSDSPLTVSQHDGTWNDNWLCEDLFTNPSAPEASDSTNIAEVFNFSPELYIQPSDFDPNPPSKTKYDYITTAPPAF